LQIELLEDRIVPATVTWINPGSGKWDVGANWSTGSVPGSGDSAVINTTGTATITIQGSDSESVSTLTLGGKDTLAITGGSLTIGSSSTLSGGLTMTGGSLTATGSSVNVTVNGAINISAASVYAQNGATLDLATLTSYTGAAGGGNTNLDASGAGSILDLPDLTTLTGGIPYYGGGVVTVAGEQGGDVDMPALTTNGGQPIAIQATASGTVQINQLTNLNGDSLTVDGTSTIDANNLSSLTGGAITVNGGSPSFPALANINDSSIYVNDGGTFTLSAVTSYTGDPHGGTTYLQANGSSSVLNFPNLTTLTGGISYYGGGYAIPYAENGGQVNLSAATTNGGGLIGVQAATGGTVNISQLPNLNGDYITIDGTSTIDANNLSSLTGGAITVNGGSPSFPALADIDDSSIYVNDGGTFTLSAVTSYTGDPHGGTTYLQANGSSSVLNFPNLTTLTGGISYYGGGYAIPYAENGGQVNLSAATTNGGGLIGVQAATGGTVNISQLPNLNGDYITIDGTSTIDANNLSSLTGGAITVNGGSPSFPALADIDDSSIYVNDGGTFTLSAVTSYTGDPHGGTTYLQANGSSSVLNFPNLTTLTGGISYYGGGYAIPYAENGGQVNLSAATSFGGGLIGVQAATGGVVNISQLPSLNTGYITIDGTSTIDANNLSSLTGGTIIVNGGSPSFPALVNINDSSIYVNGGTFTLSAVTSYTGDPHGGTTYLQASGAGSVLDFPSLTTFTGGQSYYGGGFTFAIAQQQGEVELPAVTTNGGGLFQMTVGNNSIFNLANAIVTYPSSGVSSVLNLPVIPSSLNMTMYLANTGTFSGGTTVNVPAGDSIAISGGTFTGGVTFNVGAGATVDLTGGYSVTYSGVLTAEGPGTVQFSSGTATVGLGGLTLDFSGQSFQWTGGSMQLSTGDVTNLGTINFSGANLAQIYADGSLDNYGTILETGSGGFGLHSDIAGVTTLFNEPSGSFLIESDSGIFYSGLVGNGLIVNEGLIRKTAGAGGAYLGVNTSVTNTGTIEADSGTLSLAQDTLPQITNGTLTGAGAWEALYGATLQFPSNASITNNAATIALGGAGATISGISGLVSNTGSFTVGIGASFTTTGNFSNSGTLTVGGTLDVSGAFGQSASGVLNEEVAGSASGQYGQIAATGAASLAGAFNLALEGGYSPAPNSTYPAMTFASGSGNFSTIDLGADFSQSLTATSLSLMSTVPDQTNLALTSVTAPTTATTGQDITVNWQVTNQSANAANGGWQDSVYLSTTPTITSSSTLLGSVAHTGGLAANGNYNASLTAALPALPVGDYYVIVEADSLYQQNDSSRADSVMSASTGQLVVSLPTLTLDTPTNGSFTAANQGQYYQVSVPAGGSLSIAVSSAASSGALAVYASAFTTPTAYNHQFAANAANQTNQTLVVPDVPAPTTYDILVRSVSGAAAAAGYTIIATQTANVTVAASPTAYMGGNAGTITIPISGTNFSTTTTARLVLGGTTINASSIEYVNGGEIYATFNVSSAAIGNYTLKVSSGTQSVTSPTPVQIVAPVNASNAVQLNLSTPSVVRQGRTGDVVVTATNTSNNDILAPLLDLTAVGATLKLPSQTTYQGDSLNFLATSPTGPAGTLTPGESVQITIQFESTSTAPSVNFQLDQSDDSQPMNWAAQESNLQIPTIPNAAWPIVFANFESAMGGTVASYHAVLAADATYLAQLGSPTNDVLQLVEFEIEKANAAYSTESLESVRADVLPAPGLDLTFSESYLASIAGRYYQGILGGQGWTTNWDITAATVPSSGDAVIQMSGSYDYFFLQSDGTYQPEPGEEGNVLTFSNGAYRLVTSDQTIYQFNPNGSLDYESTPNGDLIAASYNSSGRLIQLTASNGEYLQLGYNSAGQMTTLTDSNGQVETYAYTGQFLTSYTDVYGTTNYSYVSGGSAAQDGSLAQVAYADNTHIDYTYNAVGQLIDQHRDNGGEDEQFTYLTPGGIVTTDGDGNRTTSLFNVYGGTAETIDALGNVTRYAYDSNLNVIQVVAPGGLTSSFAYNANGYLTSETDPLGYTTSFSYNANNNLTGYTDAQGDTTSYAYDGNDNLLSITYADGASQHYTYNPLGEAVSFLNANGDATGAEYNSDGLVTQETFADGTSYTYTYNAQGNMTSATDAQSNVTTFVYGNSSNPNLLTEVEYPDGTWLKFSYNIVGQRTQSVDQTGFTVNYKYDALGRLSELTDASSNVIVQYVYDNVGNLIQKNNGNGTFTVYTYNGDGSVLSITNYAPSTGGASYNPADSTVNSFDDYTYDSLGNALTDTNRDGEWVYTYDADSELTGAVFTPNSSNPDGLTDQNLQYVYNSVGNRISETVNGVTTTYVSNNVNEYTSSTTTGVGTTAYQYDANGNMTSQTDPGGSTTNYDYNSVNELTNITGPAVAASFTYDSLGEMVGQVINGVTTDFQIDPISYDVAAASSGAGGGTPTAHFVFGLGLVSAVSVNGPTSYYDFDASGNTVGITDGAGQYANTYAYAPFGQVLKSTASITNSFTYSGQLGVMSSVSATYSMRQRFYDSSTGQFLAKDPLGLGGGQVNLRAYVGNNPVNFSDSTGLDYDKHGHWHPSRKCMGNPNQVTSNPQKGPHFDPIGTGLGFIAGAILGGLTGAIVTSLTFNPIAGGLAGAAVFTGTAYWGSQGFPLPFVGSSSGGDPPNCGSPSGGGGGGGACPCQCPPNKPPQNPSTGGPSGSTPQVVSHDPNALIGPSGYGAEGFVNDAAALPYTIDFENDGSSAAQTVTVTEQLDSNLDWSTFQLGSFGFGANDVTVPAGLTQYQTTVSCKNSDGTPLKVLVSLNFNVGTGLLTATFTSVDPVTGLAPAGVFDGFLFPDNSSGVGEGFVQYTVQPKPELSNDPTINQQATVVFDTNAPLNTQTVANTIDDVPPASSVSTLPNSSAASFTVHWSGSDAQGLGIASYDVAVSIDGGAFKPWLTGATGTSATYTGSAGHTYAFYSVATDDLGLSQPTPTSAQAMTGVAGAPDAANSVLSLSAGTIQLEGATTITLQTRDANGTDELTGELGAIKLALKNKTGASGTFSAVKNNGNGTYSAVFTAKLDGDNTIIATVGGVNVVSSQAIDVVGAAASPSQSVVSIGSSEMTAGASTTVTLQVEYPNHQLETAGGLAVAFKLGSAIGGQGAFGPVTDEGNGTYTATFTGTLAGVNTIRATIDGAAVTSPAPSIEVQTGPLSLAKSPMTLSAATIKAGQSVTVTLLPEDAGGNKLILPGQNVTFGLVSGTGTFQGTTYNSKTGAYSAVFTTTASGSYHFTAMLGGQSVTSASPNLTVTAAAAIVSQSTVAVSASSVAAGAGILVTLHAADAYGNPETTGGLKVAFALSKTSGAGGRFSAVTDHKNGTYTATFTGTIAGANAIAATISGQRGSMAGQAITVTPGAASLARSVVTLSAVSVKVGGEVTATLQARDAYGNAETVGGLVIAFALASAKGGQGTFGAVIDNHNGTYTVTFTATAAGTNAIVAEIGGAKLSLQPAIKVLA
jgi:RHS repeat-associated protein